MGNDSTYAQYNWPAILGSLGAAAGGLFGAISGTPQVQPPTVYPYSPYNTYYGYQGQYPATPLPNSGLSSTTLLVIAAALIAVLYLAK